MSNTDLCLDCKKSNWVARGLCWTCYNYHVREVRKGKTTWKALEKKGLAAPKVLRKGRG